MHHCRTVDIFARQWASIQGNGRQCAGAASSLSDLALLLRQELGSEGHRSYGEIGSSLRKMVVPFDGCANRRYRPRTANPNKKGRSRTS
jgi:hypothetical protein